VCGSGRVFPQLNHVAVGVIEQSACGQFVDDAIIGVSLLFLGASGGLLLYQYIRDYRLGASLEHRQLLDTPDHDNGEGEYEGSGESELQKV
jgi:hypothetical protein